MQAPMVNRRVCVAWNIDSGFDPENADPSDAKQGTIISESVADCYLIRLDDDPKSPVWFRRVNNLQHGFFRMQDGNCDTMILPIP